MKAERTPRSGFEISFPESPLAVALFRSWRERPEQPRGRVGRKVLGPPGAGWGRESCAAPAAAAELVAAIFRTTPSSPPLPFRQRPSTSHPGPTGDWPRDREETQKVSRDAPPPPCRRQGARYELGTSGCAALPGRCGDSTALRRRTPPPARLLEAAAGARFINAKALFFVPGTPLSIYRRAAPAFPRVCGAQSLLRPHRPALQSQPGSIWVSMAFPVDFSVLPPAPASRASKPQTPAGIHPAFAWSLRNLGESEV